MFERYTEKARRVIFFARYEASQFGAHAIEPEHILLGILREDKQLIAGIFSQPNSAAETIRRDIEAANPPGEKISASVDLPISPGANRVLTRAADASERLEHRHIGTEHLLLGLIKEADSLAGRILKDRGVCEESVVAFINQERNPEASVQTGAKAGGAPFGIAGGASCSVEGEAYFGQIDSLISMLAERGVLSQEEFIKAFARRHGLASLRIAFDTLLDLLVSKGVISEDDRREITKSE